MIQVYNLYLLYILFVKQTLNNFSFIFDQIEFEIKPYRESGTYILSAVDDIQILLDDHIIKTQAMRSNAFIKPFEEEIRLI